MFLNSVQNRIYLFGEGFNISKNPHISPELNLSFYPFWRQHYLKSLNSRAFKVYPPIKGITFPILPPPPPLFLYSIPFKEYLLYTTYVSISVKDTRDSAVNKTDPNPWPTNCAVAYSLIFNAQKGCLYFPQVFLYSTLSPASFSSVQFSSVAQSCPTLRDPMNCSTPGLPVHHQLSEFTQTHAHWVGDTIQPSHPLSAPSPPAPNPSQHQGLFQPHYSTII